MMLQYLMSLDGDILLWLQNYVRNDILTPVFIGITTLGNGGLIWIISSALLMVSKKTRKTGIMVLLALVLSVLINNVALKNIVARVRPYNVVSGLTSLIGTMPDFSFPSGHTGSSFAAAVVMFLRLPKKIGVPALILAFLIGFSRLYIGVHYPSDVLGGALIGTGIALFIHRESAIIYTNVMNLINHK